MNKKKLLTSIAALTLVGVIAIGGTLAYFSSVSEEKKNTFTVGTGITGDVTEDKWDKEGGKEAAVEFVPGRVIGKDPVLNYRTGTGNAYAAFTIEYEGAANTKAAIEQFAEIDWATTGWKFNDDYTIAYYDTTIAAPSATVPLFTEIKIKNLALTGAQIASADTEVPAFNKADYPENDWALFEMKDFNINVQGYLVQAEGFTTVEAAMTTAFPAVFN